MNKRAALRTLGATAMAMMLTTVPAWAADAFPSRPIKLVVPYAAGGTIDNMARILSPKLQALLKQPVIVENRAGGGTTIGADAVARADADGYTIFLGSNAAFTISPQIMPKVNYDPLKSFAAIGTIASFPNLILVKPDSPFKTLASVIEAARKSPGTLSYASFGIGSTAEISGEAIKASAKVDIVEVPYKSGALTVQAVLAGEVNFGFDTAVGSVSRVKNGQLRALATTSAQRYPELPDVPSISEAGFPGAEMVAWVAAFAPAQTPATVQATLATAFQAAVADPEVKASFSNLGVVVKYVGGEETMKEIRKEYDRVGGLLKQVKIQMN
ncbi:tripartite tricarboxylate transporter substrate binding protein [Achromobacter pestifer]|uniref:Tripartite tricarboxylate transporter substrate binding protein n=1 Tax=Achromobacter pestifer TaxID=1353889 RepID=A0A7D4DZ61_9BURK|nr:tripartite tricarboxylate transporter substrate binding protein [Achromobacter pestifer]QKH37332.1 tripartite tricarboxylate transporter substrate binding protein [Achromobacter pestifer]